MTSVIGVTVLLALGVAWTACAGGSGDETSEATSPAPSPTSLPRDSGAAITVMNSFATAVQEERLEDAWRLYAASIPGTTTEHRSDRGCSFDIFSLEFPTMTNLFQVIAPLDVVETHGSALGLSVVELSVRGADGVDYLATLARGEPYSPEYQMMFLNRGSPALVPGAPDPLQSPQFPQGYCGIWTGAR
jgi:hypothetical protein